MPWYLPDRRPVFWQELRRRLRGPRLARALGVYLSLVAAAAAATLFALRGVSGPHEWAQVGDGWWQGFALAQFGLSLLIAPALTADTICRERESGTLEGLFLSRLSSDEMVWGYLFGRLTGWLYLLGGAAPMLATMGAALGGFGLWDVLLALGVALVAGLFGGALGLLASARCHRLYFAYPLAYGYLILALIPIVLAFVVVGAFGPEPDGDQPWTILLGWGGGWLMPLLGVAALVTVWRCVVAAADEVDGDRQRPFARLAWVRRQQGGAGEEA